MNNLNIKSIYVAPFTGKISINWRGIKIAYYVIPTTKIYFLFKSFGYIFK